MVRINEAYKPLYTSKKRYFLITGGRGSLKSTSVHDMVSRLTYEKGHGVLFLRYTMASAEDSIIPEFKEAIQNNNSHKHFKFSGPRVTNIKTGSFIIFAGIKTSSGNQTAKLKSIPGLTTMVVEEGEDFEDEKTFDIIDDSIRSNEAQNRVIWIMNPTTPEHFIHKRWISPSNKQVKIEGFDVTVSTHPDVEHIHTTFRIAEQAGYLPKSWLDKAEKAKKENPKHYYHNYIGGWLERAEGVIFSNWRRGKFDESLPFCFGLDFGFNPDPCGFIKEAIDHKLKLIYIEELAYLTNLGTDEIVEMVKDRNPTNKIIIADSAQMITIHDMRKKGINVVGAKKGPGSVVAGIKGMLDYTIIVCGKSPNLVMELNNHAWNDKKSGIPIDKFNHLIDPSKYSFVYLTRL